jgi:hypothetical protein
MNTDAELAISFIQVGTDAIASNFLKVLDDKLQTIGANFDIFDTITIDDMEDISLSELLLSAIQ